MSDITLAELAVERYKASGDKSDLFDFYHKYWDKLVDMVEEARYKVASRTNYDNPHD